MMDALYSAATGMTAQQLGIDVIANNLANVNTNGYKASRLSFEDLVYRAVGDRENAREGSQVGLGVGPGKTDRLFTQGELQETGVYTNIAIQGAGFFQVVLPNDQIGYTRDGAFQIDANGQLVTGSGFRLEPAVTIPVEVDPSTIKIAPNGEITGLIDGDEEIFGIIDTVTFANPSGLLANGNNVFLATENSGAPAAGTPGSDGFGTLAQGFLERSNVQVMTEMVSMINAQRAFESVSKVISTSDEMLAMANSIKR